MQNSRAVRTDLAAEAHALRLENAAGAGSVPGVSVEESQESGFAVTTVRVLNEFGAKELCKPIGSYVTVSFDALLRREEAAFERGVGVLARHMLELLSIGNDDSVLVVGLGNSSITPDALGPAAIGSVLITRHLKARMPQAFGAFREVAAVCAGVLGTTGVESADLVAALVGKIRPDRVIAVDALAARHADRLCRTVQLSDTGIIPGSGVGNHRSALCRETLGVPVLSVGVPTVVDAATLAMEFDASPDALPAAASDMIVTPREIDRSIHDAAKLIGYAIDLALHDGLTVADVDLFL